MKALMTRGLILVAMMLPSMLYAEVITWYMATDGNNSNDCTDSTTPCSSLAGIMAKGTFTAGDQIFVKTGTYDNSGISAQISITTPVKIYGGYNADYSSRSVNPAETLFTNTAGSGVTRLFDISSGHSEYTVFDGVKISMQGAAIDAGGTVRTVGSGAYLRFNNVVISDNNATNGGAIRASIAGDRIEITDSMITGNTARTNLGGGIRMLADTRLEVRDSIIANNAATTDGGGIHLAAGVDAELINVTLYGNTAGDEAGAIYATGAYAEVRCIHCTAVGNTSTTAAVNARSIKVLNSAHLYIKNSVLINEDMGSSSAGWNVFIDTGTSATLSDGGYNAMGINGDSGFNVTAPSGNGNRVNNQAAVSEIYEADIAFNGGTVKSLKPLMASPLIDAIPNDVPALLSGTAPDQPFTSLAQANSAIAHYDHYKADDYYFKLNGQAFKAYVNDDGYVLIASSDGATPAAALTQSTTISKQSDRILPAAALAELDVDEIRITSPDSKLGNFDMHTRNDDIIADLKTNHALSNNFDLGVSSWWGTHEANMSNATCSDFGHASPALNNNIMGHCGDGTQGFHWQGNRGYETVTWATKTPRDSMNLWVRSEAGNCNGIVGTDQRGLPRPDYVNPNDPNQYGEIHDCDIGSFEWNDGYQLDCYDEDGERPENTSSFSSVSFCVQDPSQLTPKAILDNIGSINLTWLLLVLLTGFTRIQCKSMSLMKNKKKAGDA